MEEQAWNGLQLQSAVAGPNFHFWTYQSPAVVLGCSQRSLREDIERRLRERAEVIERESGGGAVLTGAWLVSASVVLPNGHPWVGDNLVDSYKRLGQLHLAALRECGVQARVVSPQELPHARDSIGIKAVDWACFGTLSPWEVVNEEGRKLVGLAQRRRQSGILLVSGALIDIADWSMLCDAMGRPKDEPLLQRCTISAGEIAQRRIEPAQFASVLRRCIEQAFLESSYGNH